MPSSCSKWLDWAKTIFLNNSVAQENTSLSEPSTPRTHWQRVVGADLIKSDPGVMAAVPIQRLADTSKSVDGNVI